MSKDRAKKCGGLRRLRERHVIASNLDRRLGLSSWLDNVWRVFLTSEVGGGGQRQYRWTRQSLTLFPGIRGYGLIQGFGCSVVNGFCQQYKELPLSSPLL